MKKSPSVMTAFVYAAAPSKPLKSVVPLVYLTAFTADPESVLWNNVINVVASVVSAAFAAVMVTEPAVSEPRVAFGMPRPVTVCPLTVDAAFKVAMLLGVPKAG